jgi:hypothetical protein
VQAAQIEHARRRTAPHQVFQIIWTAAEHKSRSPTPLNT